MNNLVFIFIIILDLYQIVWSHWILNYWPLPWTLSYKERGENLAKRVQLQTGFVVKALARTSLTCFL